MSPRDFFDESKAEPFLVQKALDGMRTLSNRDLIFLLSMIDRLNEKTWTEIKHNLITATSTWELP